MTQQSRSPGRSCPLDQQQPSSNCTSLSPLALKVSSFIQGLCPFILPLSQSRMTGGGYGTGWLAPTSGSPAPSS